MLLSAIVVSSVQTSGGAVTMKELGFMTDSGYQMSAYLSSRILLLLKIRLPQ